MSWRNHKADAQRLVDRMQFRREDVKGKRVDVAAIMEHCTAENASQRIMIEQAVVQIVRARGGVADAPRHVRGGIDFDALPPPSE